MAKAREVRRRIRSVDKTRQITKTMEMVATSKLKRASDRVHAARPYAQQLADVMSRLMDPELRERYPLLPEKPDERDERSQVQRDVKREPRRRPAEDPRRQGEMRRAADRQKLRESLDHAEDDGLENCHCVRSKE